MQPRLNSLQMRVRDVAYRVGLPRFWRWWTGELAPLVPTASRGALQRRLARPVVEFGEGGAVVWRPELVEGTLRLTRVGDVALGVEATADAAGRAAIDALAVANGSAGGAPRVVVALNPRQVLRKQLVLPMAVEENLLRTLAYDLDRHTPFRPEQVYFDAVVIDRDPVRKTMRVDWVAALRTVVDSARRHAEDWGAAVTAVVPGPASATPSRLNLLPLEARAPRMRWRQWQVWLPTALVALTAVAVVVVPLVQKRGYAIALLQQTEAARVQAEAADAVRREFERLQSDYNYALARKYMYPGTVQIIDDITRVLPDDTWLSQLELKTTLKGKDIQRDVFLRGESANGSKLISLLEDSKRVEQAALRSPTTKLQPGPGEVFDLGAQLKVIPPPSSEIVGGPSPAPMPAAAPKPDAVSAGAVTQSGSPPDAKAPDPATQAGSGTPSGPAPTVPPPASPAGGKP